MYSVESKHIRETLEFTMQSMRAIGMTEAADLVQLALIEIMREETFITANLSKNTFADKIKWKSL